MGLIDWIIPRYGEYGGPGNSGERRDKNGEPYIDRRTGKTVEYFYDPIDDLDRLFLGHDMMYDLARERGGDPLLVAQADMALLIGMSNLDPVALSPEANNYLSKASILFNALLIAKLPGAIYDLFNSAATSTPPADPLTFDLDGDGLETLGLSSANPIFFDHDGDGNKNATGWIGSDDGLLVLDRNGNGLIDNGTELFGNSTPFEAGGDAVDGFAALAQEDTNGDNKVGVGDDNFDNLRIWRDINSDGVSQGEELFTLSSLGISSIDVVKTENTAPLANGNVIADLGNYTSADGTTSMIGDINLQENTFLSKFVDSVTITEAALELPNIRGAGQVRDLREAASLSSNLLTVLNSYATTTSGELQKEQLDTLMQLWSDTSLMLTTTSGAYEGHDLTIIFQGTSAGSEAYNKWLDKLTILERFNGRTFYVVPATLGPVTVSINATQMELLNQSYEVLKGSVYQGLFTQTRLKPLLNQISIAREVDGIDFNLRAVKETLLTNIDANLRDGIIDILDVYQFTKDHLEDKHLEVLDFIATTLGAQYDVGTVLQVLNDHNVLANNGILVAKGGLTKLDSAADAGIVIGLGGPDTIIGSLGNDILIGGLGDDTMDGGGGADRYRFSNGFGQDTIVSSMSISSNDVVEFADLDSKDITIEILGEDLVIRTPTGDTLTVKPFNPSPMGFMDYPIKEIKFSDGTIWNHQAMAANVVTVGTEGADVIVGQDRGSVIDGKGGNDTITGGMGSDIIIGGSGNDILDGGVGGSDTYRFIQGFGHDTIVDNMMSLMSEDVIEFADLTSSDITLQIIDNDFVLSTSTGDTLTIKPFTPSPMGFMDYPISEIKFSDGTIWNHQAMAANVVTAGTEGADVIVGQDAGSVIDGKGGNDTITGGMGSDIIIGGSGNDILDGGMGADTFVFDSVLDAANNKDVITDFMSDEDKISLDSSIFNSLVEEGILSEANFNASTTGTAADENDYILYNTTSGTLLYDADGSGQGVAVDFAQLTTKPELTAKDFMIVS